jgi:hypothetical protein
MLHLKIKLMQMEFGSVIGYTLGMHEALCSILNKKKEKFKKIRWKIESQRSEHYYPFPARQNKE